MIKLDFSELDKMTNEWVQNSFYDRRRLQVFYGGAGSGKSYGACQILCYKFLTETPHKILVLRKVGRTLKESCFSLFKEILSSYGVLGLMNITENPMKIINTYNGNEIIFSGLDDSEKIKSINKISDAFLEEITEFQEEQFNQIKTRVRARSPHPLQIYCCFNPVSINHWVKRVLVDSADENTNVIHTTYKENKFLPQSYKDSLEEFKEKDPYYYQVYTMGEWGVTGRTVFPAQKLLERYNELKKEKFNTYRVEYKTTHSTNEFGEPIILIDHNSIELVEDKQGYLKIFKEPSETTPYVIGADTASGEIPEGQKDPDNFAFHVIDNITGEQVARFKENIIDEDKFAEILYCVGVVYNTALIGVEINFSTYPQKYLERLRYPNLYLRQKVDVIGDQVVSKFGFRTDRATRPLLLNQLISYVRDNIKLINDLETIDEMMTFVRTEKGRMEASGGSHDDLIMSYGITLACRNQCSFLPYKTYTKRKINKNLPNFILEEEDLEEESEYFW